MYASAQLRTSTLCRGQSRQGQVEIAVLQCKNTGILSNSRHRVCLNDRSMTPQKLFKRTHEPRLLEHFPASLFRSGHSIVCKATDSTTSKVQFSRDSLVAPQLEKWLEASNYIQGLGFDTDEADRILGKAFGWVHSPFWTEEPLQTVPEVDTVISVVEFMKKEIGLSEEQLIKVVKKLPEVLACRDLFETNLGILDKDWGITGNSLKNTIIRKPQVLGCNIDCKGDCMAQCTRCWARF